MALTSTFVLVGAGNATEGPHVQPPRVGVIETVEAVLGYENVTQTIRFPGADYVKLHFSDLLLLPGDYVSVDRPDGLESHAMTRPGWAMSVTGDTAIIKLHRVGLLRALLPGLGARVDKAARGKQAGVRREESICGGNEAADAVCYRSSDPVPYKRTKAVARMLINGTELCTGFRVGSGNRMMTNHHCVANDREAADTEVWFNYQCAECGGYAVFRTTKVWLNQLIATDQTLDYTIFSVTNFDEVSKFGYLELDLRRPGAGEQLYIPQHPSGKPGMIAMGNCAVDDNAYFGYAEDTDISYHCDTEGGSSGSPVLSRTNDKVVALHHFGGCPNSGVRMERIYQQVQHLI